MPIVYEKYFYGKKENIVILFLNIRNDIKNIDYWFNTCYSIKVANIDTLKKIKKGY